MNIILIGFMGTGKTVVGQKLAHDLGWNYLDTDELIEQTEKLDINEIFSQKGKVYFRQLETRTLATLKDCDRSVVATGGGIVLLTENVKMAKQLGPLVLLWADPLEIFERVKGDTSRPLLKVADPLSAINKILSARQPAYEQAADYKIETTRLTITEVVEEIKKCLKLKLP
ncbi:shikimate kinase [Candidatus Saganbacteria bacterium CG08_land_8_20_14_0_20_45_16]|uniref:Shikimate kinase n=1 Tax=Candidatus Saganbacteria bacterium CG08_land_8_20_14_0_20_45_16 TaxID=2014293 RepID=A0A2H0XZB9_UNCSA|nr:MAG: shikimate kinase [Candidatus Saganbacteria bacterium CG08_land_8_20_14_0_20_45_16]